MMISIIFLILSFLSFTFSTKFDDLPYDAKQKIHSRLSQKDLYNLQTANKENYQIIQINRQEYILHLPFSIKHLSQFLCEQKKNIKNLKIVMRVKFFHHLNPEILKSFLKCFESVEYLTLEDDQNELLRLFMNSEMIFPKLKYLNLTMNDFYYGSWFSSQQLYKSENLFHWIPDDLQKFSLFLPNGLKNQNFIKRIVNKISDMSQLKEMWLKSDNYDLVHQSIDLLNRKEEFKYFSLEYEGSAASIQTLFTNHDQIQYMVDLKLTVSIGGPLEDYNFILSRLPSTIVHFELHYPEFDQQEFCNGISKLTELKSLTLNVIFYGVVPGCLYDSLPEGLTELNFGENQFLNNLPEFELPSSLAKISAEKASMEIGIFELFAKVAHDLKISRLSNPQNIFNLREPFLQLKSFEIKHQHNAEKLTTQQLMHLLQLLPQSMDRLHLDIAIDPSQELDPIYDLIQEKEIKDFQLRTFTSLTNPRTTLTTNWYPFGLRFF